MIKVKKGQIYWADLSRGEGSVQSGMRPVCIMGNPAACEFSPVVTVLPITTRMAKAKQIPTHVVINSLKHESVVLPEQIQTISKDSLRGQICSLSESEVVTVDAAVKLQLGLA